MILLFGVKQSGKTLLANTMTTHQTHSCSEFDEYAGRGNLRVVDIHNARTKTFSQQLACRLEHQRACLVACPRNTQKFDETRDWLTFARRTFPQNPIALVVTKNDLTPHSVNLGEKLGVRFRGETVMPEAEFKSEILSVMTQSSADRLFYTSAIHRAGVRDVENWLLDVTNMHTQFVGFGEAQSRQGLLGKNLFRKKSRRDENCVGVNCEKCVVQ